MSAWCSTAGITVAVSYALLMRVLPVHVNTIGTCDSQKWRCELAPVVSSLEYELEVNTYGILIIAREVAVVLKESEQTALPIASSLAPAEMHC